MGTEFTDYSDVSVRLSILNMDLSHVKSKEDLDAVSNKMHKNFSTGLGLFPNLSKVITSRVWSPIIWQNGKRSGDNFLSAGLCALDYDSPFETIDNLKKLVCDIPHIIGTTYSHQKAKKKSSGLAEPGCDRMRLIMPFEYMITDRKQYLGNMKIISETNFGTHADDQCLGAARLFYPCMEIVDVVTEGYPLAVHNIPEIKYEETIYEPHELTAYMEVYLRSKIEDGERNKKTFMFAMDGFRTSHTTADICDMVLASPTYKGAADDKLKREIRSTVESAYKIYSKGVR